MAAYGNNSIQTPNLNKFSQSCTVFENAYVTQPVCTPSRSSIMTGLWPHTNGCIENNIPISSNTRCLPQIMSDDDYATAYMGKWHLGDEIFAQHGFQQWQAIDDGYWQYYSEHRDKSARSSYHNWLVGNGFTPENSGRFDRKEVLKLPEEFSKPAFLAEKACDFIQKNKTNPFILYVNFFEPHSPFQGPRDGRHFLDDIILPDNLRKYPDINQPYKTQIFQKAYEKSGHSDLPLKTDLDWKKVISNYWGLCSLVDTYFGKIMDMLEQIGLSEDTIVFYTSDHGDMMGSHGLITKCVMFEQAIKVPFLIKLPGQNKSRRVSGPLSQIDILPTILDLMGNEIPPYLQGRSLRRFCQSNTQIEDDVFIEWQGHSSGIAPDVVGSVELPETAKSLALQQKMVDAIQDPVRTVITSAGWKFNYTASGEHELYNLKSDPLENTNLFADYKNSEIVYKLASKIKQWQLNTSDKIKLPKI